MLRHSQLNAAAFELHKKKIMEVSMPNAAAFTTKCRDIQVLWRNLPEVRDSNAATFSHECRGIRSQTQKNKTAHSRVLSTSSLFFPNYWNLLKQNPKHTSIPKYPILPLTKIIFKILQPNIQKPKFFPPIYNKVIPRSLMVGRKSPKLLLLWILFNSSKCSYFLKVKKRLLH